MISIITTIYNSTESLERYFRSVMSQTYTDLEVLLVDDHGCDDSIALAHKITDAYEGPIRFRYLATENNSGPGVARNIGVAAATGDYYAFVDSDDCIAPDFCELLYESAVKNDSDLCCCHLDIFDEDGTHLGIRRNPYVADGEFKGEDRTRFLSTYVSYFTTFLYKKSFFDRHDIVFPASRSSEDSVMLCCALLRCGRISQVDKAMYRYMRKADSLSKRVDPLRYKSKLASLGMLMDVVRKNGWYEEDKELIDFIYFKKGYLMAVFDYVANAEHPDNATLRSIQGELNRQVPGYKKNGYLRHNLTFRLLDFVITSCPRLAVVVVKLYMKCMKDTVI